MSEALSGKTIPAKAPGFFHVSRHFFKHDHLNAMNSKESTHITISIFRGWLTTFSATMIGTVFGILYVWSVIKSGIPDSWGWSNADKALPYSLMTISFSFSMVPAGRLHDLLGPRKIILIGGFLAGLGCVISGLGESSKFAYAIGFGLITGIGVGCGYCALAPSAMRWFPSQKTGLVVGIVVSGIGMAPVFLAPISAWALDFFQTVNAVGVVEKGVSATMIALGLVVWLVVGLLVMFIHVPPVGYTPGARDVVTSQQQPANNNMTWRQMVSTCQFWLLFIMFYAGSSAGLIFISVATDIGRSVLGTWAFVAIIVLSFGNSIGRLVAGAVSDKIGRQKTMFAEFVCQAFVVAMLFWISKNGGGSWFSILLIIFMIGLNYGANHALFPSICKDYYGMQNFGFNFGLLFCAFGTAGLIMPWLNGLLQDITGKSDISYIMIIAVMTMAAAFALISLKLGPPKAHERGKGSEPRLGYNLECP